MCIIKGSLQHCTDVRSKILSDLTCLQVPLIVLEV